MIAKVAPAPFGGAETEQTALVAVRDGQLWLTAGVQTVALRPVRATLGYGTLHLTTADQPHRLRLTFASYDVPKVAQQQAAHLGPFFRELDAAGLRDLLVALRDAGARLRVSPRLRRGAGAHRLAAWVGASALLFVELALFGLPAGVLGALAGGALSTSFLALDVLLAAGLATFLALSIAVSPIPLLVRRSFEQGASGDPVRYLDTWAGRPPEAWRAGPGERLCFVPGRPLLPAVVLATACVGYLLWLWLAPAIDLAVPEPGPGGQLPVPEPAWLGGTAISAAGYAGMVLLLVVFAVGLWRWHQEPELYGIRWAPLVGAVLCFAFGQAGPGLRLNPAEEWMYLVIVGMVVAFTCGRAAVGFGLFAGMVVLFLLAAFGFFANSAAIIWLLPAFGLLAAIALRYLPGGARLVPISEDRAGRVRRLAWALWAATAGLGLLLMVATGAVLQ
ncbi:hypothetical protein JQS43_10095 [Natronosporangium hydrolyticum]|uniref:Uncharacterized protein n=1 Tax=Natronosporangium hydrolyticum TaxID=2811111 RepID=A0A895YPD4_9ACTN|nr:hypothetical protein [Natronosporangium hydrolyticum]QSB16586.1 hypothetical protein JQS43_10095 [Natronosporangium hydrolyticum]